MRQNFRVFISYRWDDSATAAGRLADAVKTRFGDHGVFHDVRNIPSGRRFDEVIFPALTNSEVVLAVIGDRWAPSRRIFDPTDWVRRELEYATRNSRPIVPVIIDGTSPLTADDLPASLRLLATTKAHNARNAHWNSDVSSLLRLLSNEFLRLRTIPGLTRSTGEAAGSRNWLVRSSDLPILALDWRAGNEDIVVAGSGARPFLVSGGNSAARRRPLHPGFTSDIADVRWSPSGGRLALAGVLGETAILGSQQTRIDYGLRSLTRLAWSADGAYLAVGSRDGLVGVADLHARRASRWRVATSSSVPVPIRCIAWHPTGRALSAGGDDGSLSLLKRTSGETMHRSKRHDGVVTAVAWSASGRRVITAGADERVVASDTKMQVTAALRCPDIPMALRAHPQESIVAVGCGDGTVLVWDLTSTKPLYSKRIHSLACSSLAWSDDGSRLVTGGHDGVISIAGLRI